MQGLTYGVVRVDTEERLSVLTIQDVGTVTPGGTSVCVHVCVCVCVMGHGELILQL